VPGIAESPGSKALPHHVTERRTPRAVHRYPAFCSAGGVTLRA